MLIIGWLLLTSRNVLCDDYADLFRQAAAYSQNGQYEQAMSQYKAALALRPGAPEALNNIAVICYQLHLYSDAFEFATKIWANHPELKSAALVAGMAAVQCNRPNDAIAPLQSVLANDASSPDALLALGSAYYALNNFPDAIHTYKRQVDRSPGDFRGWYGLAICYERSAEDSSAKLANMPGGRIYSKLMLAQYLQGAGDDKLAAEAFGEANETASAAVSGQAEQEYNSARILAGKSQAAFERVVSLAPESWQTSVFLGDVARQHGDLASALARYENALAKQPDNPAPLLGLGTVYWEMGNFDQATSYLHQTLQRNPHAMQANFELGNIAVRLHKDGVAIPLLKEYLAAQPNASAARADLGRAYLHLGQYENAVAELRKAAESDQRGDIHYQLSLALRKLGRKDEADRALQQSAALREAELQREQRRRAVQ